MRVAVILLCVLVTTLAQASDGRIQVVSLSTILSDFARNVGGDHVDVTSLIQPGMDPHEFQPTPRDIRAISQAQLVLISGLGVEGYLDKLREATPKGPDFLIVGDFVKPIEATGDDEHDHDHAHSHHHGEDGKIVDPHWWHSIENARMATRAIRDALIKIDPANRAAYEKNTKEYLVELDELARWARVQIARLPVNRRILVTSHDALGYFAHDYQFQILPVQGISTSDQPSSRHVQALIEKLKQNPVPAIFAENIENPKVLTEITRETGAKLGGTLYTDGLGDKEASTYVAMMKHNISTIIQALQ